MVSVRGSCAQEERGGSVNTPENRASVRGVVEVVEILVLLHIANAKANRGKRVVADWLAVIRAPGVCSEPRGWTRSRGTP